MPVELIEPRPLPIPEPYVLSSDEIDISTLRFSLCPYKPQVKIKIKNMVHIMSWEEWEEFYAKTIELKEKLGR